MNLPTMLIILGLAAVVFFAARSVIRARTRGGSCGCGCSSCPMREKCHAEKNDEASNT